MDQERHEELDLEVDASMSSGLMDSFVPDGQQEEQHRDAETLERVRNMQGIQVTAVSVEQSVPLDPSVRPDPNLAGHRPAHTLSMNRVGDSSQQELVFNPQPGVSSRGAGSSRGARPSRGADAAPVRPPVSPPGEERRSRRDNVGQGERSGSVHPRSRSPGYIFEPRLRRGPYGNYWDYSEMDHRLQPQWMAPPPHPDWRGLYDNVDADSPPRRDRHRDRFSYPQRVRDLPRPVHNNRNVGSPFRSPLPSSTPRRENGRPGSARVPQPTSPLRYPPPRPPLRAPRSDISQPGPSRAPPTRAPRSAPPPTTHSYRNPRREDSYPRFTQAFSSAQVSPSPRSHRRDSVRSGSFQGVHPAPSPPP